jgi:hypothetical protein
LNIASEHGSSILIHDPLRIGSCLQSIVTLRVPKTRTDVHCLLLDNPGAWINQVMMEDLKRILKRTPIVRDVARSMLRWFSAGKGENFKSGDYWEERYRKGRNSGAGSYHRLADFKAETINRFVADEGVRSVIEFGCGDGSQLRLANYPRYVGVDVSNTILTATSNAFSDDRTKTFVHLDDVGPEHRSDLSMSLDVIYHLIEDEVFEQHMAKLFDSAERFVIIYASNDERKADSVHVRHRRFTDWISRHRPKAKQIGFVKNAYPLDPKDIDNTSFADFYFFAVADEVSQK